MNEKNNVGYYSIIPAPILYNDNLKPNQKLLYAIITSLTCKEGYCYASNKYLASKLNVHPKTVSNWISDLKEKGFILINMFKDEQSQISQRRIYLKDIPPSIKKWIPPPSKNGNGIHQKMEYNNINNNKEDNIRYTKNKYSNYKQRVYTENFLQTLYANKDTKSI